RMRLMALVAAPDHVCARYRLAAFRPALQAAGHALELVTCPRNLPGWFAALPRLRRADVVILQRRLPHPVVLRMLRAVVRRLVFDFDDAVFQRDSYDARGPDAPALMHRFAGVVRTADAVVAGNDYLADAAARFAAAPRTVVVPTCVNPASY